MYFHDVAKRENFTMGVYGGNSSLLSDQTQPISQYTKNFDAYHASFSSKQEVKKKIAKKRVKILYEMHSNTVKFP